MRHKKPNLLSVSSLGLWPALVTVVVAHGGCYLFTLETPCQTSANCEDGTYCSADGVCVEGDAPADAGDPEDGGAPPADAGPDDSGTPPGDAGFDAGVVDAGFDAGAVDAGFDAGVVDAGAADGGFDAGVADAGVDAGPGPCAARGDRCDPGDTQPGDFGCYDLSFTGAEYRCYERCSYAEPTCNEGLCTPLVDEGGTLAGPCVINDGLDSQSECTTTDDCQAGTVCVASPVAPDQKRCLFPCPLVQDGGPGTCATVLRCQAPVGTTRPVDFGVCGPECIPFSGQADCDVGEACAPVAVLTPTPLGECVLHPADGGVGTDDSCASTSECRSGLTCLGTCQRACPWPQDPAGDAGTVGCDLAQECRGAFFSVGDGGVVEHPWFGFCEEDCDLDADRACPRAEQACLPEEITGFDYDVCFAVETGNTLSVGDDCSGFDGTYCSDTVRCLDLDADSAYECTDTCRAEIDGNDMLGTASHPDCADPAAVCTAGVSEVEGFCQP